MGSQGRETLQRRAQCPCCGSGKFHVLVREAYSSPPLRSFLERHYEGRAKPDSLIADHYELVRCLECGLAFQRTIPGDALVNEIYEEWIPPSEKDRLHRERSLDDYCYMAEQIQFVVQHFKARPYDIRVLDFGMGWAEWASIARAFGCHVAGAELSLHRIRHAQSIGIEVVDWDAIPQRKFNFINTEQVFEHLIEPVPVLQHLAKALDDQGLIRIAVPNAASALKRVARNPQFGALSPDHIMPIQPLEHVNCFEFRSLAALARQAGLRPIRPSLRQLYNSSSGWLNPKNALRLSLRPIYRHVYPKSTIVYLGR